MVDSYQIPLIEYDGTQEAVVPPDHEKLNIHIPELAVFAFVGECVDEYAMANNLKKVSEFISITKRYPIYVGVSGNREYALCQAPVGAPAATQIMDWLIAYGVKTFISTGSCGVLADIPENVFLVPQRALRDEGTSYHYLAPSRFVETDEALRRAIENYFSAKGLRYIECTTWTTDGFYRETKDKVQARVEEGCTCVEMECAALAACAKFRGAAFAEILFTADSLADVEKYDERGWGEDSLMPALQMCIDLVPNMK